MPNNGYLRLSDDVQNNKKGRGRPKRVGGWSRAVSAQYLSQCREGKTLSQIAISFGVTDKELKKWGNDPKRLGPAWLFGRTLCQSFHESLLQAMIKGRDIHGEKVTTSSYQMGAQEHLMAVMFEEWNLKKESKVTVTNQYEDMSTEDLNKLMLSELKRKNLTDLVVQNIDYKNASNKKPLDPPNDESITETLN